MNSPSSERGDARMPNTVPYSQHRLAGGHDPQFRRPRIVAGFVRAAPTLAAAWQRNALADTALADAAGLAAEVARLSAELAGDAAGPRERARRDAGRARR